MNEFVVFLTATGVDAGKITQLRFAMEARGFRELSENRSDAFLFRGNKTEPQVRRLAQSALKEIELKLAIRIEETNSSVNGSTDHG